MGIPELDLSNGANWHSVYRQLHTASPAPGVNAYYPIPIISIPVLFTHHILAIATESQLALSTWWLGARLKMVIDVPGSDFLEVEAYRTNIQVNRGTLVRLPQLSPQYRLRIEIPFWHQEMTITIYEYTGIDGDSTESLIQEQSDLIRVDLTRIESKIDNL